VLLWLLRVLGLDREGSIHFHSSYGVQVELSLQPSGAAKFDVGSNNISRSVQIRHGLEGMSVGDVVQYALWVVAVGTVHWLGHPRVLRRLLLGRV